MALRPPEANAGTDTPIGVADLPFNLPVVISAEIEIATS
jgi:hypothetical protein